MVRKKLGLSSVLPPMGTDTAGGAFLPDDIYLDVQWHSGGCFLFCFVLFRISFQGEKLLRIKKQKSDHTDLTFFLQDNLLGLLEQLSI